MTSLEILEFDAKHHYKNVKYEEALAALLEALRDPNTSMFQHGDSLVSIHRPSGEFHFVNAAPSQQFVHNVTVLLQHVKSLGFDEVYTDFTNPKIIDIAEQTPFDCVVVEDSGTYRMTVRL